MAVCTYANVQYVCYAFIARRRNNGHSEQRGSMMCVECAMRVIIECAGEIGAFGISVGRSRSIAHCRMQACMHFQLHPMRSLMMATWRPAWHLRARRVGTDVSPSPARGCFISSIFVRECPILIEQSSNEKSIIIIIIMIISPAMIAMTR